MFLNRLNENEKKIFLAFVKKIQMADGKTMPEEERVIREYCDEMKISISDKENYSEDELIDSLLDSSIDSKRIIVFEGIGLAYADGDYCDAEKELIEKVAHGIGLKDDEITTIEDYILKYNALLNEIFFNIIENY